LSFLLHERSTVHLFGGVLVVCAASEVDTSGVVDAHSREPFVVVELEKAGLRTPASVLGHERAAASIALDDEAPDPGRDVATDGSSLDRAGVARLATDREPFLPDILDQQLECPFQDVDRIAVRDTMPE